MWVGVSLPWFVELNDASVKQISLVKTACSSLPTTFQVRSCAVLYSHHLEAYFKASRARYLTWLTDCVPWQQESPPRFERTEHALGTSIVHAALRYLFEFTRLGTVTETWVDSGATIPAALESPSSGNDWWMTPCPATLPPSHTLCWNGSLGDWTSSLFPTVSHDAQSESQTWKLGKSGWYVGCYD